MKDVTGCFVTLLALVVAFAVVIFVMGFYVYISKDEVKAEHFEQVFFKGDFVLEVEAVVEVTPQSSNTAEVKTATKTVTTVFAEDGTAFIPVTNNQGFALLPSGHCMKAADKWQIINNTPFDYLVTTNSQALMSWGPGTDCTELTQLMKIEEDKVVWPKFDESLYEKEIKEARDDAKKEIALLVVSIIGIYLMLALGYWISHRP